MVQFNLDSEEWFDFGEDRVLNMIINNVKAKKMLSKMCIAYLEYIVNRSDKVVVSVKDTPKVQEFSNIFSDSLPGLAPKKKVEFSIQLTLGTTPISKAPYRIVPTEL